MKITNWGNYPVIDADMFSPSAVDEVKNIVSISSQIIPRGLGRCYGDSSLNTKILSMMRFDHFLGFDDTNGVLSCEAGVSLEEILDVIVPKGWFLPVTPGTKFVTIGGAIASDVHGKNHHVAGSFSHHVLSIKIMIGDGTTLVCTKTENSDLFWATCGGMGLTGIILEATFQLIRIETAYIRQRIVKAKNIDEAFDLFDEYKHWTYSVAWIDCLAKGSSMGRSALIIGEHATRQEVGYRYRNPLKIEKKRSIPVPITFPNFVLNRLTVKIFNEIRYRTYFPKEKFVEYEPFFYPLDIISGWNRIYGSRGFTQYQFVLPIETSREGLKKILTRIVESGEGSFLAVLKLFGSQDGVLSFPRKGFTLALDFPITRSTLILFDELDGLVNEYGGRLYLTKDARMSKLTFEKGYDRLKQFLSVKNKFDPNRIFQSMQSKRIGVS
jgi:FAD/FMN-containing dehydrogenase